MNKIIEKFLPNGRNFLYEKFQPTDRQSLTQIYEKMFLDILKLYTFKKNYSELPFYLNYLVVKSNPFLEKFFCLKVVENEEYTGEKSEYEILKYVCKNLDKLFHKYSNYGGEILIKLQMMQFYNLQPPQAKILSFYQPVLQTQQYEMVRVQENKTLTNEVAYSYSDNERDLFKNPFMSRLHQASDLFPGKNAKTEFIKSIFKIIFRKNRI